MPDHHFKHRRIGAPAPLRASGFSLTFHPWSHGVALQPPPGLNMSDTPGPVGKAIRPPRGAPERCRSNQLKRPVHESIENRRPMHTETPKITDHEAGGHDNPTLNGHAPHLPVAMILLPPEQSQHASHSGFDTTHASPPRQAAGPILSADFADYRRWASRGWPESALICAIYGFPLGDRLSQDIREWGSVCGRVWSCATFSCGLLGSLCKPGTERSVWTVRPQGKKGSGSAARTKSGVVRRR